MGWDALPKRALENFQKEGPNIMAMLTGQDFDHVPMNPFIMGAGTVLHGRTLLDHYTNPELAVAYAFNIAGVYGTVPNYNWNYAVYWCEDYGGEIKMPTGRMSAPGIIKYPAPTPEAAEKLQPLSPKELLEGPTMKLHTRGLKAAESFIGKDYTPFQFIYEPFVIGSFWVSPENMLMWVFLEPELVHGIMGKVVEHSINACEAVNMLYPGKPFMTLCATLLANSATMSVDQCKEFATDYMKVALEKIVKIGAGSTGITYHQCGDHGQDFHLCEDMPFPTGSLMHVAYDGLESFDLTKAAKVYENKVALLGNTDTALAFSGTPKQIYERAYAETMKYKHFKKGFVAGMACECPPFTSAANLQAWVQGTKDAGNMKE